MSSTSATTNEIGIDQEACAAAVGKMRAILDSMDSQSGPCSETKVLRRQLRRIERVCFLKHVDVLQNVAPEVEAKRLVEDIPIEEIFQNPEVQTPFLSELMLSLSRAQSMQERRALQRKGIDAAKARGVKFGKRRTVLPPNFDEVWHAWRNRECTLQEAADRCGMAKSTFRSIVLRREREEREKRSEETAQTA